MALTTPALAKLDVLIVDDQSVMREVLVRLLNAAGVACVREAEDAQAALAALAERPTDLLLLDNNMPGMNGVELARVLAAAPERRARRIVMLTGHDGPEYMEAAFAAGVDALAGKPIGARALLNCLETVLAIE